MSVKPLDEDRIAYRNWFQSAQYVSDSSTGVILHHWQLWAPYRMKHRPSSLGGENQSRYVVYIVEESG